MAMVSYSPAEYEGKMIPGWAQFLGWMMTLGPVFCVIGGVVNILLLKKIPVINFFLSVYYFKAPMLLQYCNFNG